MLTLREATVAYPDKTVAVDGVSFTLGTGENIALLGENGAGKTSLLLAIVGILGLTGGAAEVDGLPLTPKTVKEVRKRVGLVFQNPDDQLFMPYVYDDIAFGCRSHGLSEEETRARVDEALNDLGIADLRGRSSMKLSGGEKRMTAIATVLVMEPSVLLFDEPTAYLDPKARRALTAALKRLAHPKLIATHDMAFAAEVCNRVIIFKNGKIMAEGGVSLLQDDALLRRCGL